MFGHTHQQCVARDTGVIDQYIYAAEVRYYLLYHLMRLVEIGRIGGIELHLHAQRRDLVARRLSGFVQFEVRERYIRALAGKSKGDLFADTTGSARDDGCFSF